MKLPVFLALAVLDLGFVWQRPVLAQTRSAEDVFARFCELDSQGGQLTADGWQRIAALFVNPGSPRRDRIIVSDSGGLLLPAPQAERVAGGREYIEYGQIDVQSVRFSTVSGLPPGVKIRTEFEAVRTQGPGGAVEWRIKGPLPEPVVTVDAAIRYVSEVKAKTRDAAIRKNAERTLAALKHFR